MEAADGPSPVPSTRPSGSGNNPVNLLLLLKAGCSRQPSMHGVERMAAVEYTIPSLQAVSPEAAPTRLAAHTPSIRSTQKERKPHT